MDPFDVFAIPLPRSTREVLHYCVYLSLTLISSCSADFNVTLVKSTFTAYPSSLNPEGSWFNWAISEPSLLSVGISMVGYHFRNLPGRQKTSVHLQLKSYAICLTQRSLEASAFGNVSIATIATVSGLLHIEVSTSLFSVVYRLMIPEYVWGTRWRRTTSKSSGKNDLYGGWFSSFRFVE